MIVGIIVTVIVAVAIVGVVKSHKASSVSEDTSDSPSVIKVSVKDMDAVFNRSAGRYCDHCGIHGSHYTDRHNVFALYALKNAYKNDSFPDISSLVKVKSS